MHPNSPIPTGLTDVGSGGGNNSGGRGNIDYTACSGCDPLQTMNAQSWRPGVRRRHDRG